VEYPEAVAVVTVNNKGNLLLVRQYRHPVSQELLEIPAGGIEPGESPGTAVQRELREETGYRPERVTRLTSFYSAPGYSTELLHLFLAEDLTPDRLTAEDTAEITVIEANKQEVLRMIQDGRIRDGKSIAGLLFYLQNNISR
jgi:ADP-ribose pyrophosphatase